MTGKYKRVDGYRCKSCGFVGQPDEFEYIGEYEMSYSSDMRDFSMEPDKDSEKNECSCGYIGPVDYIHIESGEDWWDRVFRLEREKKKRRKTALFNIIKFPFKCLFWLAKWCLTPRGVV